MSCVASLWLMCLNHPAEAQPPPDTLTIKGKVTDRQTGAPVPDARVFLKPLPTAGIERHTWQNSEAQSDDSGTFTIEQVVEGDYDVAVLARGYQRHLQSRLSLRASRTDPLNIALDKASLFPPNLRRLPGQFGDMGVDLRNIPAEIQEELRQLGRIIFGDENGLLRAPRQLNLEPFGGFNGAPRPPMRAAPPPFPQPNPPPQRPNRANSPIVLFNPPGATAQPNGRFFEILTDQRAVVVRMQVDDQTQISARTKISMMKPGAAQGQEKQMQLVGDVNITLIRGTKPIVKIQASRATLIENTQRIIVDVRSQAR
jgi:hypothetical protein